MLEHEVLGYSSKSMAQIFTGYKEKLQEVKILPSLVRSQDL